MAQVALNLQGFEANSVLGFLSRAGGRSKATDWSSWLSFALLHPQGWPDTEAAAAYGASPLVSGRYLYGQVLENEEAKAAPRCHGPGAETPRKVNDLLLAST